MIKEALWMGQDGIGWVGWDGMGWSSLVVGSLRAPSVPIRVHRMGDNNM